MRDGLYEKLSEYCRTSALPMHMPGHKRNTEDFPYLAALGGALDITEIDSFDDLNEPSGIFAESEKLAAALWGSDECIFSVNGSTGALIASIRAALRCRTNRRVIVARNCHRSVYHALELCAAEAEYIETDVCETGFAASVSPRDVETALAKFPDAEAVILTSPTYEGVISDISEISKICHSRGVPLITDEAHGAHLSLGGAFSAGAVACGADIVVHSLHKTLPSLTQTAAVHVSGNIISRRELRRQMTIFQTSSPSYLLSSSIDGAVRYLASEAATERLFRLRDSLCEMRLRLAARGCAILPENERGVFAADLSKIILPAPRDGFSLMQSFRECGVELEMATVDYAVAMTGLGDTDETLTRFESAVGEAYEKECDTRAEKNVSSAGERVTRRMHIPQCAMTAAQAVTHRAERVDIKRSVGRVSAGYVYAYPPGIPLLVPGETVDAETVCEIERLTRVGASMRGFGDDATLYCISEKGDADEK